MNGGTRQSGFLEICLGSCWVQPRESAVLFARSSRGNVGELTATGEPLSQILKTKHKFIFCGLMCPAINRAQTQVTDRTKVEQAVDLSKGLHANRGSQPPHYRLNGGVASLILVVAALALLLPAVRAARIEPVRVLREE